MILFRVQFKFASRRSADHLSRSSAETNSVAMNELCHLSLQQSKNAKHHKHQKWISTAAHALLDSQKSGGAAPRNTSCTTFFITSSSSSMRASVHLNQGLRSIFHAHDKLRQLVSSSLPRRQQCCFQTRAKGRHTLPRTISSSHQSGGHSFEKPAELYQYAYFITPSTTCVQKSFFLLKRQHNSHHLFI